MGRHLRETLTGEGPDLASFAVSSPPSVSLQGVALHAGTPAAVRFVSAAAGAPLLLCVDDVAVPRERLVVVQNNHGVRVRLGDDPRAPSVDLVEHLFAALGGLGVRDGLRVEITGGEVPLLDGGAAQLATALRSLDLACAPVDAVVRRPFDWSRGEVRYAIAPAERPSLEVNIDFTHPAIGRQTCSFGFDRRDFLDRIAPARTFGFARDWPALLAQGRARGVDRRAVRVFEDVSGPSSGASPDATDVGGHDEPARHKLLDLLGDCTLLGGPFLGALRATRPGHAATHAFLAAARAAGAIA